MARGRRRRDAVLAVVDDTLGRVVVVRDPRHPSVRLLRVDGHDYGAVDLAAPQRLALPYLALLAAIVEALVPAGPSDLLHLGGGAFALPRALAARRPELHQTVVESSATVIALAQRDLGLRPTPQLDVIRADARAVVEARAAASVDLVVGDAFVGRDTPRHLATSAFAAEVARVLRSRGIYVVNLIDAPPWSGVGAHAATVALALPHIVVAAAPPVAALREAGNLFLVASRVPLHYATLRWRLRHVSPAGALVSSTRLAALTASALPRHDVDD